MITDLKEDSLMIGKIRKGRSFGGCIRYVTQKDDAKIIASEGVLLGTAEEMARSFRWQCLLNPDVTKPVGHIALSFKPEDAPRLNRSYLHFPTLPLGKLTPIFKIANCYIPCIRQEFRSSTKKAAVEHICKCTRLRLFLFLVG